MIGIIIGHNQKQPGMTVYNGMSEFDWNLVVGQTIHRLTGWQVFFKQQGNNLKASLEVANRVKQTARQAKIKGVVELHLNAYDGYSPISGAETITLEKSILANLLAHRIESRLKSEYGIKIRNRKRLVDDGRGFHNLEALEAHSIPAVIVEPCFADVRHRDSEAIIEQPHRYAQVLVDALRGWS